MSSQYLSYYVMLRIPTCQDLWELAGEEGEEESRIHTRARGKAESSYLGHPILAFVLVFPDGTQASVLVLVFEKEDKVTGPLGTPFRHLLIWMVGFKLLLRSCCEAFTHPIYSPCQTHWLKLTLFIRLLHNPPTWELSTLSFYPPYIRQSHLLGHFNHGHLPY